jgi:hypothetical protein
MTETPVEAFNRIRRQRRDKFSYLASLVGLSSGGSVSASVFYNRIPECWLDKLPAEYVQPIIIAKVREHVAEIDRLWGLSASLATREPADGGEGVVRYSDGSAPRFGYLAGSPVDFP